MVPRLVEKDKAHSLFLPNFHLPHTHTSTVFLGGAKFLRLGLKASFRVSLNISHVDDNDDNNGEDEAHLSSFPTTNSHMSGPDRELLMAL